jgi:hypothetical protein
MSKSIEQQAIYDAILNVNADSEKVLVSMAEQIQNTLDTVLNRSYAENAENQTYVKTQAASRLMAHSLDPALAQQVETLIQLTREAPNATYENKQTLKTKLESTDLESGLVQDILQMLTKSQDNIIAQVNKFNALAQKTLKLIIQAITTTPAKEGDIQKITPEVAKQVQKQIESNLNELVKAKDALKQSLKEQKTNIISNVGPRRFL